MNTIFHQARRVAISLLIAGAIALATTNLVMAATYYISERSGYFTGYYFTSNPCTTGWTCQDGNAYWDYAGGNPRIAYAEWSPTFLGSTLKRLDWWPFIPQDSTSINFGAIYYKVSDGRSGGEVFYTPVNQTNWKGQWVYLGYLSYGSKLSYLYVDPVVQCVPGYNCTGALKIYYDKVKITY